MAHEHKEDPLVTQAAIAYINWRSNGGQGDWEPFRRKWLIDHAMAEKMALEKGAKDGRKETDVHAAAAAPDPRPF
jgi:hypothetical protein